MSKPWTARVIAILTLAIDAQPGREECFAPITTCANQLMPLLNAWSRIVSKHIVGCDSPQGSQSQEMSDLMPPIT